MGLRFPPSGFTDATAARGGVAYASWLRRGGGLLIDGLLIWTIYILVSIALSIFTAPLHVSLYMAHPTIASALLGIGLIEAIAVVYATACLTKLHGQTPGMRTLQIRCAPAAGRGSLSTPQALTRSLTAAAVSVVPWIFLSRFWFLLLVYLGAYLWPLIHTRRQTWWDFLAATVVVDDRGW